MIGAYATAGTEPICVRGGSTMATSNRYSTSNSYPGGEFDRYVDTELTAGDRIGGLPPRRSRGRQMITVMLLMTGVGSWAYLGDASQLRAWLPADIASLLGANSHNPARSTDAEASAGRAAEAEVKPDATVKFVEPAPSAMATQQPAQEAATAPVAIVASAPAAEAEGASQEPQASAEEMPERLPPPVVDQSDPYQRRATAVGLHPELSRALLEKLTEADYRNAGVAIKTALAETPDSEVLVWPRERKAGLALFQVRFVPGAPSDCRRYVVAIVKDGWLTTALPMERCDIKPVRSAARVNSVPEKARSSAP